MSNDPGPTHLLIDGRRSHALCGLHRRDALPYILAEFATMHRRATLGPICPDCERAALEQGLPLDLDKGAR